MADNSLDPTLNVYTGLSGEARGQLRQEFLPESLPGRGNPNATFDNFPEFVGNLSRRGFRTKRMPGNPVTTAVPKPANA
jgi:hypothetical protein